MNGVFTITAIAAVLAWVLSTLKDFSPTAEVSITQEKITDPHEFETEFAGILSNLSNSRIVIIFDNLDRVSGVTALEIISTIKTFLEPVDQSIKSKQVVFLIPCDVEAIKKHVKKVLSDETDSDLENYAEEFLRKFFNTILWIPDFYSTELETFATKKLAETKIPEFQNDHLAWLIIQVFSDNPRQIIQFINTLITNYLLMEKKSLCGEFGEEDFHKNNVPQLAKYLLLIQKFPDIMNKYKITQTFDLDQDVLDKEEQKNNPFSLKRFYDFRTATNDIVIKSLEPFFNFRISEHEKALQGVSKLFQLMEQESVGGAAKYALELKIADHVEPFSDGVKAYLGPKKNSVTICVFLNGLFQITRDLEITLKSNTYREIIKKLEGSSTINIERMNPSLVVTEFLQKGKSALNRTVKEKITTRWVAIFGESYTSSETMKLSSEYRQILIRFIFDYAGELKSQTPQQLTNTLTNHCSQDVEICTLLVNHPQIDRIMTPGMVGNMIQLMKLSPETVKSFVTMVDVIKRVPAKIYKSVDFRLVFTKIAELISSETQLKKYEIKKDTLERIHDLIRMYANELQSITDLGFHGALSTALTRGSSQADWAGRSYYLLIFHTLAKSTHKVYRQYEKQVRTEFFQNIQQIPIETVEYVLSNLDDPQSILDRQEYRHQLDSGVTQVLLIFTTLYKYGTPSRRSAWIQLLVNSEKFVWLNEVVAEINAYEFDDAQQIFNRVAERIRSVSKVGHLDHAYAFLEAINVDSDNIRNEMLQNTICDVVQNPTLREAMPKYFNSSKFMNDDSRRNVGAMLLNKLNNDPYNVIALDMVKQAYPYMSAEDQSRFDGIIFSRLLLNPTSESWINTGATILIDLGVQLPLDKLELLKSKTEEYQKNNRQSFHKALLLELKNVLKVSGAEAYSELRDWVEEEHGRIS